MSDIAAEEEWRIVPGYPKYRVSNLGNVQSCCLLGSNTGKTGEWHQCNPHINVLGYPQIVLARDGVRRSTLVHVMILEAFIGPRPHGHVTCHCNGIRNDNRLENLRWDTYKANTGDMVLHGTRLVGERVNGAKLTWDKVRSIRALYKTGEYRYGKLAQQFGINEGTVRQIVQLRTWKEQEGL